MGLYILSQGNRDDPAVEPDGSTPRPLSGAVVF